MPEPHSSSLEQVHVFPGPLQSRSPHVPLHWPQLFGSVDRSTQFPPHAVKPPLHVNVHAELTQAGLPFGGAYWHVVPQPPQCMGSFVVFVEQPAPAQSANPEEQPH